MNWKVAERIVVDAPPWVDYLVDSPPASVVADRIQDTEVNVPAHFDAEVLSALGRLQRAEELTETEAEQRIRLDRTSAFPAPSSGWAAQGCLGTSPQCPIGGRPLHRTRRTARRQHRHHRSGHGICRKPAPTTSSSTDHRNVRELERVGPVLR